MMMVIMDAWYVPELGVLVARLAGFEPATRCLEGTANVVSMVRDVHFLGPMTRYQPG